jgi:hypothetical protein
MSWPSRVAILAVLAGAASACGGDKAATSTTLPERLPAASTDDTRPVFSETGGQSESSTPEVDASTAGSAVVTSTIATTTSIVGSPAATTTTAVSESGAPATTTTTPATRPGGAPTTTVRPAPGGGGAGGGAGGGSTTDVPVCDAFASFFEGFNEAVVLAVVAADSDEPGTLVEQFEVVRYLALDNEIAVLREELPGPVTQAFDTVFRRIEAAPKVMTAAGFSATELNVLITQGGSGRTGDARIATAAQALIAEFGPFVDVLELVEEIGDDEEVNGTAWLTANCPELADLNT